jgi:hypothetical protein
MKGIKCSQCGLVYWSTEANCKRCGLASAGDSAPSYAEPQSEYQPQYSTPPPPTPVVNYGDEAAIAKHLKNLKSGSIYFYVIGGLQVLLWFVLGHLMIVDGILNITLSFLAYKFRSRVATLCLLGITILAVLATAASIATGESGAAVFPIGVIIRIWASVSMVNAAFKLKGYAPQLQPQVLPPPPPNFYPEAAPQYGPQAPPQALPPPPPNFYPEAAPQYAE